MKPWKIVLIVLLFLLNLAIAQPSWADKVAKNSPEYPQVVQALNSLLAVQSNPEQAGYTAEELQQKITALQLQKLTMETSEDWARCRNETGRQLAIYARKPENSTQNSLYYLKNGANTDEDWDCEAIYLPSNTKVTGLNLPVGEPTLLKIVDGTQLVARTNPITQEIQLNVPSALIELLKAEQVNFPLPNLAQADIDVQVSNAPTD